MKAYVPLTLFFFILICYIAVTGGSSSRRGVRTFNAPPIVSYLKDIRSELKTADVDELKKIAEERSSKNTLKFNELVALLSYFNYLSLSSSFKEFAGTEFVQSTYPILISASGRVDIFLDELLVQLNTSESISSTFIVVSHDHFNTDKFKTIANMASGLRNLHVAQVFFPYGHIPHRYFGSPIGLRSSPDSAKLHFFWSLQQMFNSWNYLQKLDKDFVIHHFPQINHLLLLEDDYWVLPDFYVFAKQLSSIMEQECPDCLSINMGAHTDKHHRPLAEMIKEWRRNKNESAGYYLKREPGFGGGLGAGIGIRREQWIEIEKKQTQFCHLDNTRNWDTLVGFLVVNQVIPLKHYQFMPVQSRVHHGGKCSGMNARKRKCHEDEDKIWSIANQKSQWKDELLPLFRAQSRNQTVVVEPKNKIWYSNHNMRPGLFYRWRSRLAHNCDLLPFVELQS